MSAPLAEMDCEVEQSYACLKRVVRKMIDRKRNKVDECGLAGWVGGVIQTTKNWRDIQGMGGQRVWLD